MERAAKENKKVIVQGDANLCSTKWQEDGYGLSYISNELLSTLAMCGMEIVDVGNTYLADRLTSNGELIESAIDHVYHSVEFSKTLICTNLKNSSTDHVPIMAQLNHQKVEKTSSKIIFLCLPLML